MTTTTSAQDMRTDHVSDASLISGSELIQAFQTAKDRNAHEGETVATFFGLCAVVHETERRVRAAMAAPVVPEIPEGWELKSIFKRARERYDVYLWRVGELPVGDNAIQITAGPTWQEALAAAIAAAEKGGGQ